MNKNRVALSSLRTLRSALETLDADLRKTKCPTCGKPTGGFVPAGKKPAEVGICTGHETSRPKTDD